MCLVLLFIAGVNECYMFDLRVLNKAPIYFDWVKACSTVDRGYHFEENRHIDKDRAFKQFKKINNEWVQSKTKNNQ